ncbi:MAG: hypothetical protein QM601_09115 [Pseudoxanthomonas sp.]
MTPIHKVPASAGAHWLLSGLALLRRAPWALAVVALSGFFVVMLAVMVGLVLLLAARFLPGPLVLLPEALNSLLTAGASSFVFAGMLYAVREVALGRAPQPRHLFHGFEHPRSLLLVALAPMAAGVLMSLLLIALVGEDAQKFAAVYAQLQQASQAGQQADPQQLQTILLQLPLFNLSAWLALALGIMAVTWCVMMLAVPLIVFGGQHGLAALRVAMAAAVRNLAAMLLYLLLLALLLFGVGMAAQVLAVLLQVLVGPSLAVAIAALLQVAAVLPLLAGGAYQAYHQIFEGIDPAAPARAGPPNVIAA